MPHAAHVSVAAIGPDVGRLIAAHIDITFRAILRGPGVAIEDPFIRLVTGEPHPFGNFAILRARADERVVESAIVPLVECGAPAAVLATEPPAPAIVATLKATGFEPHEGMPAMAVDIAGLGAAHLPDGYTLARVGAGREGDEWAEAFATGYELPAIVGELFSPNAVAATTAPDAAMQFFAIRKGGRMVCTSALFIAEGVTGVYCVATVAEERKKGLAAFATAEPLRQVRGLGQRVGVLQSSPAGHGVYRRLGFRDFGEVGLYVRMPG